MSKDGTSDDVGWAAVFDVIRRKSLERRELQSLPLPADNSIIVHLVHGTWPTGPLAAMRRWIQCSAPYPARTGTKYWFQKDSKFCNDLEKKLVAYGFKPDLRPFIWSGANSFRQRARAAEELVAHLGCAVHERKRQVIIAHSHGGAVAVEAIKLMAEGRTESIRSFSLDGMQIWLPVHHTSRKEMRMEAEDAIESLTAEQMREGAKQTDVVTMATPFLRVEQFGSKWAVWNIFAVCWMLAVCSFIAHSRPTVGSTWPLFINFMLIGATAVYSSCRDAIQRDIVDRQTSVFHGKRIQCFRGLSDEASMGIAAAIAGCNIIRTLIVLCGKIYNPRKEDNSSWIDGLILLVILSGFVGLVAYLAYYSYADHNDPVVVWGDRIGVGAACVIAIMIIASLLQGALGVELIGAGFSFLTSVESSPDAVRGQVEVVTLAATKDTAEGLRHSLYVHADCVPDIVNGLSAGSVALPNSPDQRGHERASR